ncbi:hypothetical protein F5X68DRAFT_188572 [Plectosphaerella plurivora]|uniref:Uncharacterized protein n=1 Tax=Plectosphaerella plurivora TaxID=936078 RepID=A0A9P8VGZ7_9PEZI|nr:hypothetical protein F5X68DRAFT_188572 [Plectosphaerella plurivora]
MAPLAPIPAKDISALYDSSTRELVLDAQGNIPGFYFTPFFQRERFAGGLLFSLRAYTGGIDPPPKTDFTITERVSINLPLPYFNNKSVQVQTGLGSFAIEIKYTGIPGPGAVTSQNGTSNGLGALLTGDDHKDGQVVSDVLPPIPEFLTGGADLRITAQIPKQEGNSRTSIVPSFNPEYLKIVDSSYESGQIAWTFQWLKVPVGPDSKNPQIIDITTTTWNGFVGPAALTSIIIQGYIVHFVVLK